MALHLEGEAAIRRTRSSRVAAVGKEVSREYEVLLAIPTVGDPMQADEGGKS